MPKKSLEETRKRWREAVYSPFREKRGERMERFVTTSDIEIEPLYSPLDFSESGYPEDLGFPGQYPFT
ncbi:MAG: methylmalonyl-CoA mutase, partial [Candidatus Krumholzibacteria bacterium]|nr:methylmalonyl-CoA mutase [Candidatus Krumholzibacteria bacterium]